jgi:hypothetical protein
VIEPEEVLLLQYAYSLEGTLISSLFKQYAMVYGPAISNMSLRHTVIAYAASESLSPHIREKIEDHKQMGRRALINKLQTPSRIDDGDIFAANTLVWLALKQNSLEEAMIHVRGFVALLRFVYANEPQSPLSEFLVAFEPLLWDDANFVLGNYRGPLASFSNFQTMTFRQRMRYFEALARWDISSNCWQSVATQTLVTTIGDLMLVALSWLRYIVTAERENDSERQNMVECTQTRINSEFSDVDLQLALNNTSSMAPESVEWRLMRYHFTQVDTIKLLLDVLNAPTVLEGLASQTVSRMAAQLVATLKSLGAPTECVNYYGFYYRLQLAVAALGLKEGDQAECNLFEEAIKNF